MRQGDPGPAVGTVLDGKYRLDSLLGSGGMGRVFRGVHLGINRAVAIKVLHPEFSGDAASSLRFRREALTSGGLDHPNIVAVSDVGLLADGSLYLVMEVLEGETLGARLDREHRLPWQETVEMLRGMLAAVQHAHDHGVVHCDIKPENVFLARKHGETFVKLLDFGIARIATHESPADTLSGTPDYVSPEQALGAPVGPASDLYSLSVLAYEMLSGRVPFTEGDARAKVMAHLSREPPPFSPALQIPPALEQVVRAGLAKRPEQRIGSAREYQDALDRVLAAAGMAIPTKRPKSLVTLPSTAFPRGYEVLQSIGRGGMAEVFLARQRGLAGFEKLVVLKKIHAQLATRPEFVEMFLDEARLAARINDPHVVQIYELGETQGNYFIAMEYLLGESLDTIVATVAGGRRAPTPYLIARIIADAAAGLHAAHELRAPSGHPLELVHRDVSQANLVVLYSGNVKVVDFGIAKARTRLGAQAAQHGKPGYLSPEQIEGREIDRRSDVFSLGVVLWETLTSRYLFVGRDDRETMERIRHGVPPPPSAVAPLPREIDQIVLRALAKNPNDRYPTAEAMRGELEGFLRRAGQPSGELDLATYMRETFPERIEQRSRLVDAAEHDGRELPVIERIAEPERLVQPTRMIVRARGDRSRLPIIAFALAGLGVIGAAVWISQRPRETHQPAVTESDTPRGAAVPADAADPPPLVADPLFDQISRAMDAGRFATAGPDGALALLARAAQRHPGDPRVTQLRTRAVDALRASAQVLWDHGKQDSARVIYGDLLRLAPDDSVAKARALEPAPHTPSTSARSAHASSPDVARLVSQIDLAIIERRLVAPPDNNALDYLLALRKIDPNNEASRRLGSEVANALSTQAHEHPDQAATLLEAAKQAHPTDSESAQATASDGEEAKRKREQARQSVADGNKLLASGSFDEANATFQRAISLDPTAAGAFAGLADVAFNQGDYARAVLSAKRAVALAPAITAFRMTLAKSYYKLLRYDDAIREWQKIVDIEPANATAKKGIELARAKSAQ